MSPAAPGSSSGDVIHVTLAVPLASAMTVGSACGAADLQATGPKAPTIPGSSMTFMAAALPNSPGATESATAQQADGSPFPKIGEQRIPATGMVIAAITTHPAYPAACAFHFDVAITSRADVYAFAIDSIYFPIPLIPHAELVESEWSASIAVNPQ